MARYYFALTPNKAKDTKLTMKTKKKIIRAIQIFKDKPQEPTEEIFKKILPRVKRKESKKLKLAIKAAREIIFKLWAIEDAPMLTHNWMTEYYFCSPIGTWETLFGTGIVFGKATSDPRQKKILKKCRNSDTSPKKTKP